MKKMRNLAVTTVFYMEKGSRRNDTYSEVENKFYEDIRMTIRKKIAVKTISKV
jgi:hypothetical protein